jgi:hypothetical protein
MSETDKIRSFAENCGMSKQNAERYKSVAKIITPIQQMFEDGQVTGISSLVPIAALSPDSQNEVYNIMVAAYAEDEEILTRPNIRKIVSAYKEGADSWEKAKEILFPKPVSHGEINPPEEEHTEEPENPEEPNEEPDEELTEDSGEEPTGSEEAMRLKAGTEVKKQTNKLINLLNEYFSFKSTEDAKETVNAMMGLAELIVVNCNNCVEEMGNDGFDTFMNLKRELKETMDSLD